MLFGLLAAVACANGAETPTPARTPLPPVEGQLHRDEQLSYGEAITVKFIGVSQDSRCAKDVVCVRAGEAYVQTTMTLKDGEPTDYTMIITPGGETWATYGGYLVTLMEGEQIDYVAHLRIEEAAQ